MPITRTDEFNKTLEAQQNLVAGYDPNAQLAIIEDLMNQEAPMSTVLRAAVLMSLTTGGLKPKPFESFKRDFLQVRLEVAPPLILGIRVSPPPIACRAARPVSPHTGRRTCRAQPDPVQLSPPP
jgi:hypothetical protein